MTRAALDAFALRDVAAARTLPDMDELVDRETGALVRATLARGPGEWSTRAIFLARCAERIADHAVKIARAGRVRRDGRARRLHDVAGSKRNLI